MSGDARLRVLAEVSHAFAMVATDYRLLLDEIAKTTAYLVGDGCQVTLIEADGETLFNAASAHRDPQLESVYKTYLAGVGVARTTSQSVSAIVARTGQPKLVADISPASVAAQSDEALRPLVARLNVHSFVVVPIRARGTIIGTLSLMRSGPGRGYTGDDLILLQDLADRSGLAIENARLYDQLERRVRQRTAELEAVNQDLEAFSYSVAHDLRAPLRSIDGFSRAVLDEHAERLDDTGREHLKRVVGAAQHMGQLIDGLLDLSRVSRADLRRERVDLSALARDVSARLALAHPQRTVEFTVEPGLQTNADRRLAEVVLTNLIGNAWKFTAKRAIARIHLGVRPDEHPQVFFVCDNGAGFPRDQADRLFGVFQRLHADDEFEGTGIGLATVHRIVRRHGGRIWAESEATPGAMGATFFFILEAGEK
jgi:signal transduction histidine kinase